MPVPQMGPMPPPGFGQMGPPPPQMPQQFGQQGGFQGLMNKMFMGNGDPQTMQRNMMMAGAGMLGASAPQGGRVPGFGEALGKGMMGMQQNAQNLEQQAYRNSMAKEQAEREKERLEIAREERKRNDEERKRAQDYREQQAQRNLDEFIARTQAQTAHAAQASQERQNIAGGQNASREKVAAGNPTTLQDIHGLMKQSYPDLSDSEIALKALEYRQSLANSFGGMYGGLPGSGGQPPPVNEFDVVPYDLPGSGGQPPPVPTQTPQQPTPWTGAPGSYDQFQQQQQQRPPRGPWDWTGLPQTARAIGGPLGFGQ